MIQIRWHIPAFMDPEEAPLEFRFESQQQMLAHPRFQQWSNMTNFKRWSRSDNYIMGEFSDGTYYVVATVEQGFAELDLPTWRSTYGSDIVLRHRSQNL